MEENKNIENVENSNNEQQGNSLENNAVENNETSPQRKKSSAELIIEKLNAQKKSGNQKNSEKIENLNRLSEEIEKNKDESEEVLEETETEEQEEAPTVEKEQNLPNYNEFDREKLTASLEEMLEKPYEEIKNAAEIIRKIYYKKKNEETVEKQELFIQNGGKKEDFKLEVDDLTEKFNNLFRLYRDKKQKYNEEKEAEKIKRLEEKTEIIDKIEALITKGETLNKTFEEFHKLRDEWVQIGPVNAADARPLLEKYNFTLQKFYDWVKINKELRDLDLKKNLDQKIKLCEEAETLILEPKITKAYKKLQDYHEKWKEIGPVPNEQKEEIWERFKEASALINKKHYNYFQEIKEKQAHNLKAKEILCEEAEKIANEDYTKVKDWQEKTEEINGLIKLWKLIGFAPKKYNNAIYERFLAARKLFYDNKHEFFQNYTDILNKNLQLKEEIVIEVENIKDSSEWNKTSARLIELQKKWKDIGPVPNDHKDGIWKKFNEACNVFFERKREYFKTKKELEQKNYEAKKEIIEKIKNLEAKETPSENLVELQKLQKEWSQIGYVPFKHKDEIYAEYHDALNQKYKNFEINKSAMHKAEQKNNIEEVLNSNQPKRVLSEIEKIKNNIAKVKGEIITIENNLTFFVKSKNSGGLLKNLERKLEKLKQEKAQYEQNLITLTKSLRETQKNN